MDVLFFLILGHFCGDYAFQTDNIAERKKSSKAALAIHVVLYTVCIWAFLAAYSLLYLPGLYFHTATLMFLAFLFIEHWTQDYLKSRLTDCSKQAYYIDQVIHIALLYFYRIFIFPG
jgi:protein-S-isoprenylcysteine O-methyltransferase Ste14